MSTSPPPASDRSAATATVVVAPAADPPGWSLAAIREVWAIAFPTVLTMTSYTVMQFMDKLMVGQVGPLEVAAQGNGGVWTFSPIAFAMGAVTIVNTYVAQNLGAGTPERSPRYAWAGAWISLVFWAVVLLPYAVFLPWLFGLMNHSEELRQLETTYGRIMLLGGIALLVNKTLSHFFFGLHRPVVITIAAVAGNIANVVLNYTLIFGEAGIPALNLPGVPGTPALGLAGAAIATVIGTIVELAIPACVFLGPKLNRALGTRAAWRPRWEPVRQILQVGWPGSIQFGNELICWAIFMSILVGAFGADHMTAGWATLSYMHLSFMPAVGFSAAVTALVGKYIGAGKPDVAVSRARIGLVMAVVYSTLCGIVFVAFRHPLIGLFVGGDEVTAEQAATIIRIGGQLMICAAIFQAFDALGIVYLGALRGAGDTVWPGFLTLALSWSVIVGGGWAVVELAPGLESLGPWIAAAVYIIVLGIALGWRFERGSWRRIRLIDQPTKAGPVLGSPPDGGIAGAVDDVAVEIAMDLRGEAGAAPAAEGAAPAAPRSA